MEKKRSVQSASQKLRNLKKRDGEPLWRADIQYDLLQYIFTDKNKVFTNPFTGIGGCSFADVYIETMARSSKCSKILSDKLLGDRKSAICIAMICLLVNIGRMNTTLNFFPEMKAQLRTYHSIPSLQTNDTASYKQLQDAPRLKSILKGACEDHKELKSLEDLSGVHRKPKTNPINLLFLISGQCAEVELRFFPSKHRFFDLIMDTLLSSVSRGTAFLWLMYNYLETDLSAHEVALNPFGPNLTEIPPLVFLSPEQARLENVDLEPEVEFGHRMTVQRQKYLEGPKHLASPSKKRTAARNNGKDAGVSMGSDRGTPADIDSETQHLVDKAVYQKRLHRRAYRLEHGSTLRQVWNNTRELDPVFNSDDDFEPEPQTMSSGMLACGLHKGPGDYGESCVSLARVLTLSLERSSM